MQHEPTILFNSTSKNIKKYCVAINNKIAFLKIIYDNIINYDHETSHIFEYFEEIVTDNWCTFNKYLYRYADLNLLRLNTIIHQFTEYKFLNRNFTFTSDFKYAIIINSLQRAVIGNNLLYHKFNIFISDGIGIKQIKGINMLIFDYLGVKPVNLEKLNKISKWNESIFEIKINELFENHILDIRNNLQKIKTEYDIQYNMNCLLNLEFEHKQ